MDLSLNAKWESYLLNNGADFACFVDTADLPGDAVAGYTCVVFFGKAISKEYIRALMSGETPKTKEVINTERKMDKLAVKTAMLLEADGYKSQTKLKFGQLPHKTVALRAGLGFIGKNNLLVTEQYGCAVLFGKVLTTAPFITKSKPTMPPQCGACTVCVDVCAANTLLGKTWDISAKREDMMVRKNCTLCQKCMIWCPYTVEYAK